MQNELSDKTITIAIPVASRAAGVSKISGASFDCQGYRSLVAIIEWGVIVATAVSAVSWQGSDDGTDWVDLTGTGVDVAADDDAKLTITGLDRPVHRYNRIVVSRSIANAALSTAIYVAGKARDTDIVHDSAVVQQFIWYSSPAAGTP